MNHKTDTSGLHLDRMVYLMNYRLHYEAIDINSIDDRFIIELFFFRSWTVQFGYRIFSTDPANSEAVVDQCVNMYSTLGKMALLATHGIDIERKLGMGFMDALENRWGGYDLIIEGNRKEGGLPTRLLIGKLMEFSCRNDPIESIAVCLDFVRQIEEIKSLAIKNGFIHNG